MSDYLIVNRYTRALYDAAMESSMVDQVGNDLKAAQQIFTENIDLINYLNSPSVTREDKLLITKQLFSKQVSELVLNFWLLLLEKNRQSIIPEVFSAFDKIRKQEDSIYQAIIVFASETAVVKNEKMLDFIVRKANLSAEASVECEVKIDHSLIGGFVLYVNNMYFDYSIRSELDRLKLQFV